MERTERIFELLGDIDDALVVAAAPKPVSSPAPRMWKKWLPVVACLCLTAIIGTVAWRMNIPDPVLPGEDDPTVTIPGDTTSTPDGTTQTPPDTTAPQSPDDIPRAYSVAEDTQEKQEEGGKTTSAVLIHTLADSYPTVTRDGISYTCVDTKTAVNEACLGTYLNTGTTDDNSHTVTYYSVADLDPADVLAVRFNNGKHHYIYCATDYQPATLGELVEQMHLRDLLQLGDVYVHRREGKDLYTTTYTDPNDSILWETLLNNATFVSAYDHRNGIETNPASDNKLVDIMLSLPHLAIIESRMWITDNGYLVMRMLGATRVFRLDDSTAQTVTDALAKHDPDAETLKNSIIFYETPESSTYADRIGSFIWDGRTYYHEQHRYAIDLAHIDEQVAVTTATPYKSEESVTATCYRLGGMSEEAVLAVRFGNESSYHLYAAGHFGGYQPETLGDLIEDLNLREHVSFGNVYIDHSDGVIREEYTFIDPDDQLIWDYLLTETDAIYLEGLYRGGANSLGVSVSIPLLGIHNLSLSVQPNGYTDTNMFYHMGSTFATETNPEALERALMASGTEYQLTIRDYGKSGNSLLTWDDMNAAQRFGRFFLGELCYISEDAATVDIAQLGEMLGTASTRGYDTKAKVIRETDFTYYAIADMPPEAAVAVRFSDQGDDAYYLYKNPSYVSITFPPATLGEFTEQTGLQKNITFEEVTVTIPGIGRQTATLRFNRVDPEKILAMLFADPTAVNTGKKLYDDSIGESIRFTATLNLPEHPHLDCWVDENGHLVLIYGYSTAQTMTFDIGKERAQAFIDYIRTECVDDVSTIQGSFLLQSGESRKDAIIRLLDEKFTYDDPETTTAE